MLRVPAGVWCLSRRIVGKLLLLATKLTRRHKHRLQQFKLDDALCSAEDVGDAKLRRPSLILELIHIRSLPQASATLDPTSSCSAVSGFVLVTKHYDNETKFHLWLP